MIYEAVDVLISGNMFFIQIVQSDILLVPTGCVKCMNDVHCFYLNLEFVFPGQIYEVIQL